jgi:hypothetical protein
LGKSDDCYEPTSFRNFRDNWLKNQPKGEKLIAKYYNTAPEIVKLINSQPERYEIYKNLNEKYLSKCLYHIEKNENEECKNIYIDMMNYLFMEKEKWQ